MGSRESSTFSAATRPSFQPAFSFSVSGFVGDMVGSIAYGIGWGTGTAIAHRVVDAIFGPRKIEVAVVSAPAPCKAARVVDAVFGSHTIEVGTGVSPPAPSKSGSGFGSRSGSDDACSAYSKAFMNCLNGYGSDIRRCQAYMDRLRQCKLNSVL